MHYTFFRVQNPILIVQNPILIVQNPILIVQNPILIIDCCLVKIDVQKSGWQYSDSNNPINHSPSLPKLKLHDCLRLISPRTLQYSKETLHFRFRSES